VKSAIGKWPKRNRLKNSTGNALLALATVMLLSGCDAWNLKRLEIKCANASPYNIKEPKLWENYIKIHEEFYTITKRSYYIKHKEEIGLMTSSNLRDKEGGIYDIYPKPHKYIVNEIKRSDYILTYKNPEKKIFKKVAELENYYYAYPSIGWGVGHHITKNCAQDYPSAYLGKIQAAIEKIQEAIDERR